MRVFSTLLVLGAITVLVPIPDGEAGPDSLAEVRPGLLAGSLLDLAEASGLCRRDDMGCSTADWVLTRLEQRTVRAAGLARDWTLAAFEGGGEGNARDGSRVPPSATPPTASTLSPADLEPAWRGPKYES